MNKQKNSRPFFLVRWFNRLFGGSRKELSFLEEEALQSPFRTTVNNFRSNKLSMLGLIVFLLIFAFVMVGPAFFPLDLSYEDNTQANVAPGLNMMDVPQAMRGSVRDIAPGTTYGVGVDQHGKVHIWGYTRLTDTLDLADIPEDVLNADIVNVAAGYDHIVALDSKGGIHVWGNDRLGQADIPKDILEAMEKGVNLNFVQIEAGFQFSMALTADGHLYTWGNGNSSDIKVKKSVQGSIAKAAAMINNYIALNKEGEVVYGGTKKNAYTNIPEAAKSGVVDIAAAGFSVAALKEDGTVVVWGNATKGEQRVPAFSSKVVKLVGGRYHYTALLEDGSLVSWGDNGFGQSTAPSVGAGRTVTGLYAGYYQNYAVYSDGTVEGWGLKGYLMGTDEFGRSILTRIVNGGQVTMTVGAISVVIALAIGIIMGGVAGYFGGKADMLIMRISEIVGGLPFLPFALILSAIIGTRISVEQRMYLIMVVLGVLSWPGICRLVRAQILAEREKEFVTAAKAIGVRELGIVFKHIIPNVISVILVTATLDFATSMLTESTLSYLGFGISPPTPTWGNMLTGANNSVVIQQYWWRWVFPALIFSICTICINLIGDGLRDAVDPKSAER